MKDNLLGFGVAAFLAIGHFVFGYSAQDCWLAGLALAVIYLANENRDLKYEISHLRMRVDLLEGN
jgi:hypothetical protein